MSRNSPPPWNPKRPQMPFDNNGNWLDYPMHYNVAGWETVHQPFPATFVIDGMRTGRSSKKVILRHIETSKEYPMFVADLVRAIQEGTVTIRNGQLDGYWTGSKRGANYGIKAVEGP